MKRTVLMLIICSANAYAFPVTANFTGQQEIVQTVTGKSVVQCHYRYNSQEFTRLYEFGTICPMSIQVE